jgi:EAL domain-containing protein (putative c-di-GMP-specific phosphodiesterase class I)
MVRLAAVFEERDACDDTPSRAGDPGRLFLWFPIGLAERKVSRYLRRIERTFKTTATGALTVDAPDGYPQELMCDLAELLTDDEAADTRCVFKNGMHDLEVEDIGRVRTVRELRELQASAWLVDMLRGERLTSVFQPIVYADQTNRLFGHEALVRGIGQDGRTMSPGRLFDAARNCGMVTELDSAAHRSAIRAAATHDDRRQLFLNFTPAALRDGIRCLAPTIDAIDAADIPRNAVVLEVTEAEQTTDIRHLRTVLDSVRSAGFRVALDDIGCGDHSRRLIHEVRPDFIKLDMEEVRRVPGGPSVRDAERLLELAQQLKIETIAEGVETSEELDWNRQFGATYVQGYFIARPAALTT